MKKIIVAVTIILFFSSCRQIVEFVSSFLYAATKAAPDEMELKLPEKEKDTGFHKILSQKTLTILLYNDDGIFCYQGYDMKSGKKLFYGKQNSIKDFLVIKKKEIPENEFRVVIKPGSSATYKNTVDMLDEMSINKIERYSLMDITKDEENFIKNLK